MKENAQKRTKLLGEVEMNSRFAKIVAPEVIAREQDFYGFLVSHAGKEVDARELVFIITIALTDHYPQSMVAVSMKEHVEAMLGESGSANQVKEEFFDIMLGVAKIHTSWVAGNAR